MARSLVKFPGLFANSTFQSLSASRIYKVQYIPRDTMCESDAVWIDCYRVTQNWSEGTVKCNSSIWNAYTGFLDDADYMTVYTLQQLSEYEFSKGDYLKFEGCLKTIDKIRQRSVYKQNGVSKYQYRNSNGAYITPNDYEYTSSGVRLEISTNQITTGGFLLNSLFRALLNQVGELIPPPFDDLESIYSDFITLGDVIELLGQKNEYAYAEVRHVATNWIADKVAGYLKNKPGKIGKLGTKMSKVLLVAAIAYDTYHIARGQTRLPGNYAIQIDIYTSSGVDTFIGDYGYKYYNGSYSPSKHMKNIINEYFDPWDNGIYNPITPPIYGHATISYSGLQYSGGSSKVNDDFGI